MNILRKIFEKNKNQTKKKNVLLSNVVRLFVKNETNKKRKKERNVEMEKK